MAKSNHRAPLSDTQLRVKAIESIMLEKGIVEQATMDAIIDNYEHRVGPHVGAKVVARAWMDPEFKTKLLEDSSATLAELDLAGIEGTHMEVKENTPEVHNMVVCTLCSCYPWALLGLPPSWYKSTPYRARAVRDPRGILEEFGVNMADDVEVRVWDSNAEIRYLVLPMRPAGTADFTEEELAALVTRDAMIGTSIVESVN